MDDELIYLGNIKRTILVVDDEEINREILGGILEDHYDVLYAADGDEALSVINEKGPLLSLVLLDLIMPTVDGFAVMEEMQNDIISRNIPVIVLTSEESAEIESLKKGAADFIKKPYDMPEKIIARVKRIIALFEDRMIIQSTYQPELSLILIRLTKPLCSLCQKEYTLLNNHSGSQDNLHLTLDGLWRITELIQIHP